MVEIWLPYGKTEVAGRIPDENLVGTLKTREKPGVVNPTEEIMRALERPIESQKLEELASSGKKVVIVVDDKTRPAPSNLILPCLLEKLEKSEVKEEDITIIVGCGTHSMGLEEAKELIGREIANRKINLIIHDPTTQDLKYIGTTSFGTKVYINKTFVEADVRILTGDICYHYYAGYGGGRKSILPAISGVTTIQSNHVHFLNSKARTGNIHGNPVHMEMEEAAHFAQVNFTVNVVMNSNNEIVKAYAGGLDQVFQEGVKLVDEMFKINVAKPVDIVIVSSGGYPQDIDLYQAYKGIDSVKNIVKDNGVIILVAECPEGYGNKYFYDWMVKYKSFKAIQKSIKKNFVVGSNVAYYLLKMLERVKIILVSSMPDYYARRIFKMRTDKTLNSAITSAFRIVGRKSKVLVVPKGAAILPILNNPQKREIK